MLPASMECDSGKRAYAKDRQFWGTVFKNIVLETLMYITLEEK